ncbi:MAG TPA: adenylate/guanylate cyclase domain-containing protein, partial [Ramlibacter sp.]|nr:adenylate/guanylate cyclase domain-containing protein [Ramlibacter sp.]
MTPSSPARPLPAFAAADLAALSRYLPACVLADGGGDIDPGSVLPPRQRRFSGAVLVADIAGFSSLTEGLAARGPEGAEQLAQVLDAWFGHMTGVALDHGGDVVDFVGDALVVVWPAQELQAAALQAARCALALQAAVAAVAADTGLTLAQRIGLGAGELSLFTVGGLGGQWHWLVAGAPVAQAATAYAQGQPGDTVVDAESWPLLAAHCHGQPLQAAAGWRLLDAGSPALPAAIATPAAKPGWLARYLPASLLERHASGATAWRGEFRTLSVLMIGLPGLDPATADALAQLQGAVGGIQRELLRGGGRIERLSMDDKGISLLVAFGLPRASFDDDASRALRAAWGVSATLAERGISGSIGVTTGRVFCGDSGGTRRRHLSLAGASVNAAARLMQQHDGLLCDAATASAAARAWNFAAVEDDHTTAAPRYRPTPRAIPVARRSDSLLLGRDAEQQQLDRTLQ